MNTKLTKIISGLFVATKPPFRQHRQETLQTSKFPPCPTNRKSSKSALTKRLSTRPALRNSPHSTRIALDFEQTQDFHGSTGTRICRSSVEQNQCRTKQQPRASSSESEQTGPIQYRSTREQSLDIHQRIGRYRVRPRTPRRKSRACRNGKTTGCRTVYQVRSIRIQTLYPGKTTGLPHRLPSP